MLAAGLGQTSTGHAVLQKAGLFEQPAGYTALAFHNPQSLPEQLNSQRAEVIISFEIHNTGGIARAYQWTVLLVQGTRTDRVAAGSVSIPPAQGTVIARTAQIFCTRGRVRMVVSLAHPAESIEAWAACKPSVTRHP